MKSAIVILVCALFICCHNQGVITYEEGIERCFRMVEEKIKDNPEEAVLVDIDCIVGAQIPDFETFSIKDRRIGSEMLKGKVSIINFWFISCPPCVAEIPGFNAIVEKIGKEKVNYIAIGRDGKEDIEEFLIEHLWSFDHIVSGKELIRDKFHFCWSYPTTFLVNKHGRIIHAFSGGIHADSNAVEAIQNKLLPLLERELK